MQATKQSVRLTPDAKYAIRQFAKKHGCSQTEAINRILADSLEEQKPLDVGEVEDTLEAPPAPKPNLEENQVIDSRFKVYSLLAYAHDIRQNLGGTWWYVNHSLGILYRSIGKARSGQLKFIIGKIFPAALQAFEDGNYLKLNERNNVQWQYA